MRRRYISAVLATAFIGLSVSAHATIVGSTYNFTASTTGTTTILATNGTYTDPSNPGFCVGPPTLCSTGFGLSGSFTFAQSTPTLDTITFHFSGSTDFGLTGSFSIDLGNFVTTDGERITGVTYASGSFFHGNFTNVSFNGTDAVFTGTPDPSLGYNAELGGGRVITFDVTTAPSGLVPEPSSLALFGAALLGFGAMGSIGAARRRCKRAQRPRRPRRSSPLPVEAASAAQILSAPE